MAVTYQFLGSRISVRESPHRRELALRVTPISPPVGTNALEGGGMSDLSGPYPPAVMANGACRVVFPSIASGRRPDGGGSAGRLRGAYGASIAGYLL